MIRIVLTTFYFEFQTKVCEEILILLRVLYSSYHFCIDHAKSKDTFANLPKCRLFMQLLPFSKIGQRRMNKYYVIWGNGMKCTMYKLDSTPTKH